MLRRPRNAHVKEMELVNIWICVSQWSHKPDTVVPWQDGLWTRSMAACDSVRPGPAVANEHGCLPCCAFRV